MIEKKIAIVQSNYIPWKGYFDLIAAVDEIILYDDVQYTKNDWRNRNRIKTSNGVKWLTIPTGPNIARTIREVKLPLNNSWQKKHWRSLELNYCKAPQFKEISWMLEPLYLEKQYSHLHVLNRVFIETICKYLDIKTTISSSSDYQLIGGPTARLVELCLQARGTEYISGPTAIRYLDTQFFTKANIKLSWFNYDNYMEYPQLWGDFLHTVSIVDLLFNCGKKASYYMRYVEL